MSQQHKNDNWEEINLKKKNEQLNTQEITLLTKK